MLDNQINSTTHPNTGSMRKLEESPASGRQVYTRQQVERHRSNAVCASCHSRMDPLGFALENFDVIGRWRTQDEGGEIDASGKLPGGKTFAGPKGLKELLLSRPDDFVDATIARL